MNDLQSSLKINIIFYYMEILFALRIVILSVSFEGRYQNLISPWYKKIKIFHTLNKPVL